MAVKKQTRNAEREARDQCITSYLSMAALAVGLGLVLATRSGSVVGGRGRAGGGALTVVTLAGLASCAAAFSPGGFQCKTLCLSATWIHLFLHAHAFFARIAVQIRF